MSDFQEFFNDDPWEGIISPCYPEGRRLYRSDKRFWVSMNDSRQILFFVHESGAENVKTLENLAGVKIEIERFKSEFQRLVCTLTTSDSEMKEKFSIVVKDVAHHCSRYSGTQLFVKVQDRIKSWANFLKPKRSGLSNSEFVGFWGELYTVSELLMKTHSPSDAVRFWIGPEGKKQDITFNSMAIEVKTSLSGDARTIKISSIEQLERITEKLYLLHIIAGLSDNESGISIEDLYQQCLQLIEHDAGTETLFLQKTSELYGKASETQLKDKLSIISLSMFDVRDNFPRISRENISQSIVRASYDISIPLISEFEITENIKEIFRNG